MKREFPIENLIRIDIDRKLGVAYAVYEEENKLEVGKWYKGTKCSVLCVKTNSISDVGFDNGKWGNDIHCLIPEYWQPANMEVVEKLLIKEADKRGFKDGIKYKSMTIAREHVLKLPLHTNENHLFDDNGNVLFDFKSGQWAEIIEEEIDLKQWLGGTVNDIFMDFLYYDRKEDKDMGVDQMRNLMDEGKISKQMMTDAFIEQIKKEY